MVPVNEITYDNVVCDKGWVRNLAYPVSQKDLSALCKRLPRFYNNMGELFLMAPDMKGWVHNV